MQLDVTQSLIQTALRNFLLGVLPAGVEAIEGQDNRVPEPVGPDFVIFTITNRDRFSTNVRGFVDCAYQASIAGTLMTVSSVNIGELSVGAPVFGTGVSPGTTITALSGGTGGVGGYVISPSQSAAAQEMASGTLTVTQSTQLTFQIDVHGPNSSDNAQVISTLFRDEFGLSLFQQISELVVPLYADTPRQSPFINAESQYEYRWTVDAVIQAVQSVILIPQQYAQAVSITPIQLP
jgi:hypothetical protein